MQGTGLTWINKENGPNLVQRMAPGMLVEYERGELCRQITRVGVRCTCSQARSLCKAVDCPGRDEQQYRVRSSWGSEYPHQVLPDQLQRFTFSLLREIQDEKGEDVSLLPRPFNISESRTSRNKTC